MIARKAESIGATAAAWVAFAAGGPFARPRKSRAKEKFRIGGSS